MTFSGNLNFLDQKYRFECIVLRAENVICLAIRVKMLHIPSFDIRELKLIHYNIDDRKWLWSASSKYGFLCFNALQPSGRCPDFEYRLFSNCDWA